MTELIEMQKSSPNKRVSQKAVALSYEDEASLPTVVATGIGYLAEQIIGLAERHGVPVMHEPMLAEILGDLQCSEAIPPEAYMPIAEILCFLYLADQEFLVSEAPTSLLVSND